MVLLTRGRSQDQPAVGRRTSEICAGCRVVVLNGRHFPSFSAGDEGVVLSVDQEAHNCFVRFKGNDTSVPVALRHLRAMSQPVEEEGKVEEHRTDAYPGSRDPGPELRLDADGEAAFGDAPAIDEVESSMMRMDISTDSGMRGAEAASSSPFSLSMAHGGRSSSQAILQPATPIPVSPASRRPQIVMLPNGNSPAFATASAASVAAAVQNSGLLRNGGADGFGVVKTTAPAYIERNANMSSSIQVPPVQWSTSQRSGQPTFGPPSPQHSNSLHFEQQGRFLDMSSSSAHSEAPGFYGGGISVLSAPPVAAGQGWMGNMPTPSSVGGTQGDPNAAARGARLEAVEQRLMSIEAEYGEKVAALQNALEGCIGAIMSCPQPPERAEGMPSDPTRDRDLLNAWQSASMALRSVAERGTQVLRVTAVPLSSVGIRPGVVRSSSCAGPRGRSSGATPVSVEVVGSSGQWDVSASAMESGGVRRNRSSSPAVGTGQRRYFGGSPNGKSGPQHVYRDILNSSSGLPMSSTAGPLVGSPEQQHSGLLTPGSHARLSPGGASGMLAMQQQQPFLGWGAGPSAALGHRGSPLGPGMQPLPSGPWPSPMHMMGGSPPPHMMGGIPGLPGGPPVEHLNHSPGPMQVPGSFPGGPGAPPMGFGPGFPGWPSAAESNFPLLAPGALPPLPGLGSSQTIGPPPGQPGSAGTRPETFQAAGPGGGTFQAPGQRPGSAMGPRPETFLDVSGSGHSSRPTGPVPDTFQAVDPWMGQSMYVDEK